MRPDGRPHLRPLICGWLDDALHVCSNPSARKAKNMDGGSFAAYTVAPITAFTFPTAEGPAPTRWRWR